MEGQRVLLSSFRNEAPFVLEFVAHHRAIGFDQIIIASNDCSDGTDSILAALDALGVIRHLPCQPPAKVTPQHHAYAEIRRQFPVDRATWAMILDADEFLNIHVGRGLLEDLIAAQSLQTGLILINWAWFGASGHQAWDETPSCQRFTHRLRTREGNGLVKSLIRDPGLWPAFSNHHPYGRSDHNPLCIAYAGGLWTEVLPANALEFGSHRSVKPQPDSFRLAQINHYATRTEDSFALRQARGRGAGLTGKANQRHTAEYFRRMSAGTFEDTTILRHAPAVAALMAEYRRDPGVEAALQRGLGLYRAEIARYWQTKP